MWAWVSGSHRWMVLRCRRATPACMHASAALGFTLASSPARVARLPAQLPDSHSRGQAAWTGCHRIRCSAAAATRHSLQAARGLVRTTSPESATSPYISPLDADTKHHAWQYWAKPCEQHMREASLIGSCRAAGAPRGAARRHPPLPRRGVQARARGGVLGGAVRLDDARGAAAQR
jgi:hypothetical protein